MDNLHFMSPADIKLHMGDESPTKEIKIARSPLSFFAYNGCSYQKVSNHSSNADFKISKGSRVNLSPSQTITIPKASGEEGIDSSVEEMKKASDEACNENDVSRYKKKFMFSVENSDPDPNKKNMMHISFEGFVHSTTEKTTDTSKEHQFQIIMHDPKSFKVHRS